MRYLFYLSKLYSMAIIKPLTDLMDREGRDWALYVSRRVSLALPEAMQQAKIFTTLKEAKDYRPDYVLVPGNFVDHRIPGVKVQIFHGLGVEKASHFKIRHFFDVYFTSGPYVTERFMAMRAMNPYFEVIETGWLKIDGILSYPTQNLRQKWNVPIDKRIILYAPTFSNKMVSAQELAKVIPESMKDDEYWLFKFHQLMPKELMAPFKSIPPSKGRIFEDNDISPCLHMAELMISDTSSVVYEFYALNKPVITYKAIKRPHKALDIRNPKELRQAIDKCLYEPSALKEIRQKAMAEVNPYLDGSIASRTLKALDSLDPKSFPKPGKPFNFFRKAQIVWHGIAKKGYLR